MTAIDATIIRGEALDVLRTLPSESVAGVITDPPYSSGGQFRGDRTGGQTATEKYIKNPELYAHDFGGDSRDQRSFLAWCALWMSEARRVTTPGGVIACFPLPMLRDLMRLVVRGGTVLDPFVGSGAHGAAALLEGHPFIGIEMSEPYAEIARQTIEQTIAAHGLSASELRKLEARGGRVGGPTQVTLFDG